MGTNTDYFSSPYFPNCGRHLKIFSMGINIDTGQTTPTAKLNLPPVIFGTSALGNLYEAVPDQTKLAIIRECINHSPNGMAVFDTAGKYGAGLALEVLGKCLQELGVPKNKIIISNKLGWYRVPLTTPEPTFEPGVWKELHYDAVQRISYRGILECFEQGNQLLGTYNSQMASVHDPDEYLEAARDSNDEAQRYNDILGAYRALKELKNKGTIQSIGVGAKNWRSIKRLAEDVKLDWIMIANSLTIHSHPADLLDFIAEMHRQGTIIINSAVFNGGFLVGKDHYNYKRVDKETEEGRNLFAWREKFFGVCKQFNIHPAEACFNFGLNVPGVSSVALSTAIPEKVKLNIQMATKQLPEEFWLAIKDQGLIG